MESSSPLPILVLSLVISLVGGGVAGALITYWLQRRGVVTCVVSEWEAKYRRASGSADKDQANNSAPEPEEADRASVSFLVEIYNEKGVDTGLRGVSLEFVSNEGRTIGATYLADSPQSSRILPESALRVINLPSGSWQSIKLYGEVGNLKMTQHIGSGGRVEFVGYFPDGSRFSKTINPDLDGSTSITPLKVRNEKEQTKRPFWKRVLGR